MLGFAPLAAAPLGATGDGIAYNVSVEESAAAAQFVASLVNFPVSQSEASVVSDVVQVAASTFNPLVVETLTAFSTESASAVFSASFVNAATASDAIAALAVWSASILDSASTADTVSSAAIFQANTTESATASDLFFGALTYIALVAETVAATDQISSIGTFFALTDSAASISDSPATRVDFPTQIAETAAGDMSALVAPSTFSARVNETANAIDAFLSIGVLFATITDSAMAADEFIGRLLWEIINDSQSSSWGDINSAQTSAWGTVDSSQATSWGAVNTAATTAWGVIDDSQSTSWQTVQTQT